jgi:hypothetical protein
LPTVKSAGAARAVVKSTRRFDMFFIVVDTVDGNSLSNFEKPRAVSQTSGNSKKAGTVLMVKESYHNC